MSNRTANRVAAPSIPELVDQYFEACENWNARLAAASRECDQISASLPKPPALIRATVSNYKKLHGGSFEPRAGWYLNLPAIRPEMIQSAINEVENRKIEMTEGAVDKSVTLVIHQSPLPLKSGDARLLAQLKTMLDLSTAWWAERDRRHSTVEAIEKDATSLGQTCSEIERKIVKARCRTAEDFQAKLRLYRSDERMFSDAASGQRSLLENIVDDVERLMADANAIILPFSPRGEGKVAA